MSDTGRPLGFAFRTSSHSGGGECVEVALAADSTVIVQDTKDPFRKTRLSFSFDEWNEFLREVRQGKFDFGM